MASDDSATVQQPFTGVQAQGGRQPIDIETLAGWAVARQSGWLPWRGDSAAELAFNHNYDAVPRGYHGVHGAGGIALRRPIGDDAAAVIDAIMALPGADAALVVVNARAGSRPAWEVAPRRVPILKRHKRRHRPVPTGRFREVAPTPEAICAAREAYRRWWRALDGMVHLLRGKLNAFEITELRADAEPWADASKKAA